jgi:hypothetical protein
MLDDSNFNIDILIEINDVESEEEILEYFANINNILKIQDKNLPQINYIKFINLLKNRIPKAFDDNKEFPYLSAKKILEELKITNIFEKINPITLMKKFDEKNNYAGLTIKDKYYPIRKDIGFYLNENWIQDLIKDFNEINNEKKIVKIPKSKIIKNDFEKLLIKHKKYYLDNYDKYILLDINNDNILEIYFENYLKKNTNNFLNNVFVIENKELYGYLDKKKIKFDENTYFAETIILSIKSILIKFDKKEYCKIDIDKLLKPKIENIKKIKKIIKKYL